MALNFARPRLSTMILGMASMSLAVGWASRERSLAQDKAPLKSQTITLDQVKMADYSDRGDVVGKLGIYLAGDTPESTNFVTGRLVLDAGKTPHPPHTHPEEEIMVIEQGNGEIEVDGKITEVGPGSVMYTTPNVPHGIVNTGKTPIIFYFIKWAGKVGK
ncbi:cupin domain-containing protein [Tundrisphaera lichenicola]|uniref:cupin domain-containing protein n=1 Tax=Tundrisphaera lichenicola TaxID=2029860 RepID=UPI003EB9FBB8